MRRDELRLTSLLAAAGIFAGPPPAASAPVGVAASAGASDDVAAALDRAVAGLPPGRAAAVRAGVLDPLGRAPAAAAPGASTASAGASRTGAPRPVWLPALDGRRARARQVDETTCGSAVLTMLAMAGDPRLALRVAADPAVRFGQAQRHVHRRTCERALGPLPWPTRLGTPPWAAARVARYGDVRYTHRVVGGDEPGAVLRAAVAAARAGVPVPLYTGGDLRGGWQAAVPRHVVLLTGVVDGADADAGTPEDAGGLARLYEPSAGTLHTLPVAALVDPAAAGADRRAARTAALGGWPHVTWAVLPLPGAPGSLLA